MRIDDAERAQTGQAYLRDQGIRSALAVPLTINGVFVGVLYTEINLSGDTYGQNAQEYCESMGTYMALLGEQRLLQAQVETRVDDAVKSRSQAHARALDDARAVTSGHMAGGFAHLIRNALGPARHMMDFALGRVPEAGDDPDARQDALAVVSAGVDRALEVATATLDYAQAAEIRPGAATTDLATVVGDVLSGMRRRMDEKAVVTEIQIAPGTTSVIGRDHIAAVLRCLMDNAFDAVDACDVRCVRISAARQDSAVVLTVQDTGKGIDAKAKERIFEPFFTTKGGLSRGLGLGLAQRIMRSYGGSVEFASAGPAQGATFSVTIPDVGSRSTHRAG